MLISEREADAYLVEWARDGKTWVVAHARYTAAADEATRNSGRVIGLFRSIESAATAPLLARIAELERENAELVKALAEARKESRK